MRNKSVQSPPKGSTVLPERKGSTDFDLLQFVCDPSNRSICGGNTLTSIHLFWALKSQNIFFLFLFVLECDIFYPFSVRPLRSFGVLIVFASRSGQEGPGPTRLKMIEKEIRRNPVGQHQPR